MKAEDKKWTWELKKKFWQVYVESKIPVANTNEEIQQENGLWV